MWAKTYPQWALGVIASGMLAAHLSKDGISWTNDVKQTSARRHRGRRVKRAYRDVWRRGAAIGTLSGGANKNRLNPAAKWAAKENAGR